MDSPASPLQLSARKRGLVTPRWPFSAPIRVRRVLAIFTHFHSRHCEINFKKEGACEAVLVLGPAGSRPALYASFCLRFWWNSGEFRPGNHQFLPLNGTQVTANWAGERPTPTNTPSYSTTVKWGYALPFPAVSLFVLLSFLPPVRALLCGRLPHTAPLVLPARPRADKTTLLLPRHPHTRCLVGGRLKQLITKWFSILPTSLRAILCFRAHEVASCRLITKKILLNLKILRHHRSRPQLQLSQAAR